MFTPTTEGETRAKIRASIVSGPAPRTAQGKSKAMTSAPRITAASFSCVPSGKFKITTVSFIQIETDIEVQQRRHEIKRQPCAHQTDAAV
jgi:hypothetical protein